ncbi:MULTISPECIES: DHHA1 domain-containing protein [unclassified Bacillus (in: firmicutes)]|uniref:alanyl-tRNA editing protein n=1 Tax=unclassified Bacillus (in: firmicutes) TaxID=185979 RepID=UPI0008ECF930|nr:MULTISPECIES: DHHA1 domain-containing protein [unclassified Bacillus (in: firmicutes)]SFI32396.1 alanyl-tRNA synthetase [Bacillus sp. 71mf]SFS37149.1 alanyl-tRNA synthetase [Bacillus sp. 103mf]
MNHKLFYADSYLQTFTAQITKQIRDKDDKVYVVLTQTAFYPTGGGQPHDTGYLNQIPVINVEEIDGEIRHYITEEIHADEVTGHVSWKRRFDHMQQHAGQHILSAIFWDHFNIPTIGFHLGREIVTIDLETSDLSLETAEEAAYLANQIVFENRPITVQWVNLEEAKQLPLRKEPTVTENIRVVIIEDLDYNGCGGTHPKQTGEVGPVQIINWERHKGNIRLTFVCGWRAIELMKRNQSLVKDATQQLHSKENDIPSKIKQLLSTQKETEKALQAVNEKLILVEANELLQQAEKTSFGKQIGVNFTDRSMQELAKLAAILTEKDEYAITYFVTQNGENLQCICACGPAVKLNMNILLKAALPLIEGKGGGNPKSARGGGKATVTGEVFLSHLIHIQEETQEA